MLIQCLMEPHRKVCISLCPVYGYIISTDNSSQPNCTMCTCLDSGGLISRCPSIPFDASVFGFSKDFFTLLIYNGSPPSQPFILCD